MVSIEFLFGSRGDIPAWARMTIASGFAIWGARQLWTAGNCFRRALDSSVWPCVRGTITTCEIATAPFKDGHVRPRIEYAYTVQGSELRGDCIAFGLERDLYGSSSFARHYMERYPTGSTIYVFYDPTRPDVCVLEPGMSLRALYPLMFGLLTVVVAALMAFAPYHAAD